MEKAPTKEDVRDFEEQNKKIYFEKKEREKLAMQSKIKEADKINARSIIEQLSEMFQNKKVSSQKGCSISGIPSEMCSDEVLATINEYLDGEWIASFQINTGNSHDFEMTNTLLVRPYV